MSVRKTKKGGYQTDVRDKEGQRVRVTFKSRTEAAALNAKIEKEKHDLKLAGVGITRNKVNITEAIKEMLEEKESLAPKSYAKYKNVFRIFEEFTIKKNLIKLNDFYSEHADEFKKILTSSGASAKTINFYLISIRSMFKNYVLRDNLIKNPFDHIKLERIKKKTLLEREGDYYSSDDIKAFFSQSMENTYKVAFVGLFLTGMRYAELSNLTWKRVDMTNKIIEVRTDASFKTKTASSERDIPISNKLSLILTELAKHKVSDYVFPSPRGGKMPERSFLSVCKSIAEEAKITKNATLHMWRHSFNSHLAQSGVDYSVRQYLMGHKPQTMTDHYTKIDAKKLHSQVSLLDNLVP